jgi:hypothetical protein
MNCGRPPIACFVSDFPPAIFRCDLSEWVSVDLMIQDWSKDFYSIRISGRNRRAWTWQPTISESGSVPQHCVGRHRFGVVVTTINLRYNSQRHASPDRNGRRYHRRRRRCVSRRVDSGVALVGVGGNCWLVCRSEQHTFLAQNCRRDSARNAGRARIIYWGERRWDCDRTA